MESSVASKRVSQQVPSAKPVNSRKWIRKAKRLIWASFFLLIFLPLLYVYAVKIDFFGLFGGMPGYTAVENPENDLSSDLISSDGVSMGRYFRYNNRSQVHYNDLSPHLVQTLLLSEDHRFYGHAGLDFLAFPRVIWGVITFRSAGGGSTITQQLAKNLYTLNPEMDGPVARLGWWPKRIVQKTKEWIISVQLEKNFTKEEIITMYLNTSHFGSNADGIKVASETYFNKQPKDLNIQESAVLVGLLQNPSLFNPHYRPRNALKKRNQVLFKLFKHNYIATRKGFDSLRSLPIDLQYRVPNQNEGIAPYFRTILTPWLLKWCKDNGYDLYESGLKIFTTIDSRMQTYAEQSMAEQMSKLQASFQQQWDQRGSEPWVDDGGYEIENFIPEKAKRLPFYKKLVTRYAESPDSVDIALNLKKRMTVFSWTGDRDTLFSSMDSLRYYNRFLQAGMMAMDPLTGEVKAWVGGIRHKYFKFDHVRSGTRQPGSTFKAFVYGKAIEEGYSPCHTLYDISPSVKLPDGSVWEVRNSEGDKGSGDRLTLRQGLALSKNTMSVQLIELVRPENVVEFARRLGITTNLNPVPSLALGTSDVRLFDMVAAYSSFVNLGIHTDPFFISRIEDKNGNVIESFIPQTRQVMDEKTAYKMVYMLQGGVEEVGGTSGGINPFLKIDNEIGGKTGTTDKSSDGWYMGITNKLVTGVWVGGDEPRIHFPSWVFGAGGKTARPIWENFMLKIYQDPSIPYGKGNFIRPTEDLDVTLDCSKYDDITDFQ
jgi:penicillin-binding protein 1A